MKKTVALLFFAVAFLSCAKKESARVERSFYYWKNDQWDFQDNEDDIIVQLGAKKLYVKYFEVEHNDVMGNYPAAKTNFYTSVYDSLTIVPTVYLRNEVFLDCTRGSLDTLADNVNFLIGKYSKEKFPAGDVANKPDKISEYQMDCDWTPKSRANYFYFLKKLKALSQKEISCTLRLYPFKYPDKMGVPPVDRVTLMCYNLINPLSDHTRNSILDLDELEAYVKDSRDYPLHLDVALPIYSWMQLYQNNHFTDVIYKDCNALKRAAMKPEKPLWFEVTKDTAISETTYLRIGDKIKYEEITPVKINKAIEILRRHIDFDDAFTVTLFHLDANQLSNYKYEDLSGFYTGFSR